MSAVALQSFGFGEQLVRVVDRDGGIWFVANDVCAALEIANPRNVVARLEADERDDVHIMDAIGRMQNTTIVSESGLYALIFRSRKPVAVSFRRWVTGEVLPAIRRTGRFEVAADNDEDGGPVRNNEQLEQLRASMKLVELAQRLRGTAAALRLWRAEGLPDVFAEDDPMLPGYHLSPAHQPLADWMAERCELAPGHRIETQALHADFEAWCEATGREPTGLVSFARLLNGFGIGAIKSNRSHRVGLRLRED